MRVTEGELRRLVRWAIREAREDLGGGRPQGEAVSLPGRACDWDAADGEATAEELAPWIGKPFSLEEFPASLAAEPPAIGERVKYLWKRWEDRGGETVGVYEDPVGEATFLIRRAGRAATVHPPKRGVVQI